MNARAPLLIHHFLHQNHNLVLREYPPYHDRPLWCNACGHEINSFYYHCSTPRCRFNIHHFCASMPLQLLHHPYHPHHALSLLSSPPWGRQSFVCRLCGRNGQNWLYLCNHPDCQYFEVHPGCAMYWMQLPRINPNYGLQPSVGFINAPRPSSNMGQMMMQATAHVAANSLAGMVVSGGPFMDVGSSLFETLWQLISNVIG